MANNSKPRGRDITNPNDFKEWLDYMKKLIPEGETREGDVLLSDIEAHKKIQAFNKDVIQAAINEVDRKFDNMVEEKLKSKLAYATMGFCELKKDRENFQYKHEKAYGPDAINKVRNLIQEKFDELNRIDNDDPVKTELARYLRFVNEAIDKNNLKKAWINLSRFSLCYNQHKEHLYITDQSIQKSTKTSEYKEHKALITKLLMKYIKTGRGEYQYHHLKNEFNEEMKSKGLTLKCPSRTTLRTWIKRLNREVDIFKNE
jgi:hypothetical protein